MSITLKEKIRLVLLAMTGNFLEFFDFALYGLLMPIFSTHFFGEGNPERAFFDALLVYAIGFLSRPLGALLFGHIGDRYGRKTALIAAIFLMAGATLGIGLCPSYAAIGISAPLVLCLCRLAQGLSAGGEGYGSIILVLETFPVTQRGLASSLVSAATISGVILATGVTSFLTRTTMPDFSWKFAFIGGSLIGFLSFLMRLRLTESPLYTQATAQKPRRTLPIIEVFHTARKELCLTLLISAVSGTLQITFSSFISIYLFKFQGMPYAEVLFINAMCLLTYALFLPIAGWITDRVSPLSLMLGAAGATVLCIGPIYLLLTTKSFLWIVIAQLWLGFITAFIIAPKGLLLFKLFPTPIRYTGLSFGYATGVSLFGGFTPIICTFFLKNGYSPAVFPALCGMISLLSLTWLAVQMRRKQNKF